MKYMYTLILLVLMLTTWFLIYTAQYQEYDDNIASISLAFLISFFAFVFLIYLWFKKQEFIRRNGMITIVYLILNSPLSIALVLIYYNTIFGPLQI